MLIANRSSKGVGRLPASAVLCEAVLRSLQRLAGEEALGLSYGKSGHLSESSSLSSSGKVKEESPGLSEESWGIRGNLTVQRTRLWEQEPWL